MQEVKSSLPSVQPGYKVTRLRPEAGRKTGACNRRSSRQILFRKIGLPLSALAKRHRERRRPRATSTRDHARDEATSGKTTAGPRLLYLAPTDIQFFHSPLFTVSVEIPAPGAGYLNSFCPGSTGLTRAPLKIRKFASGLSRDGLD